MLALQIRGLIDAVPHETFLEQGFVGRLTDDFLNAFTRRLIRESVNRLCRINASVSPAGANWGGKIRDREKEKRRIYAVQHRNCSH